jgi:TPR repeat protein
MARFDASHVEMADVAPGGGTPDGLFQLGLMHCVGRDVPLDLVAAHMWFNIAALRGNAEAKRYRMEIAAELTKAEIAQAQRQAREWLSRH